MRTRPDITLVHFQNRLGEKQGTGRIRERRKRRKKIRDRTKERRVLHPPLMTFLNVLNDAGVYSLLESGVRRAEIVRKVGDARSLAVLVEDGGVGHSLVGSGQEDDLAVGRLGHGLHGLEVADLHGGSGREDVGSLAHELGSLNLLELGWLVSIIILGQSRDEERKGIKKREE